MSSLNSNRKSSTQEIWVPGDGAFGKGENPLANRLHKIHALQDELTSSPSSHDVMELILATATSLDICLADDTPLVWFIVSGNPGSDKTQTVFSLKGALNAYFLDTLTAQSFISGYINEQTGKPADDLLPKLDGKCLVIKDLTSLFSEREEKVKAVLGALQSIYDGAYARAIGTRGTVEYDSHFSIIGCITPLALRKHHRYMSLIGSRFLINRVLPLSAEEIEEGFAIVWDTPNRKALIQRLQALVVEHVEDIFTSSHQISPETPEQQESINRLAQLLAKGRSVIYSGRTPSEDGSQGGYEIGNIQTEEPWRGVYQLRNLGRALTRVHGRSRITSHELELLRRVVLSSISVDWGEVLGQFRQHPDGFTVQLCAQGIGKSEPWVRHLLKELEATKIIHADREKASAIYYLPGPEFKEFLVQPIDPLDHSLDLSGISGN
ncbi:MAG: hypothetical protein IH977_11920 [Nitrospinae bacterium]|nr:hypothetical protein [Nitrospinota bacterium]